MVYIYACIHTIFICKTFVNFAECFCKFCFVDFVCICLCTILRMPGHLKMSNRHYKFSVGPFKFFVRLNFVLTLRLLKENICVVWIRIWMNINHIIHLMIIILCDMHNNFIFYQVKLLFFFFSILGILHFCGYSKSRQAITWWIISSVTIRRDIIWRKFNELRWKVFLWMKFNGRGELSFCPYTKKMSSSPWLNKCKYGQFNTLGKHIYAFYDFIYIFEMHNLFSILTHSNIFL